MRTTLLLLLATISAPAFAQEEPEYRRGDQREARSERPQRAERAQRSERTDEERAARRAMREERRESREPSLAGSASPGPERRLRRGDFLPTAERAAIVPAERPAAGFGRRGDREARREVRDTARETDRVADVERPAPGPRLIEAPGRRARTGDSVADWRIRDRGDGSSPELVQEREGATPEVMRDRRQRQLERFARRGDADGRSSPGISRVPREGTQPVARSDARPARYAGHRWRGDWRRDRRYDWSDYRRRNGSRFRLGIYFDPFGWNYRRYHVGWRLWPSYYRSSYWLSDPWSYRLPYAPAPYRWIRYHDDALLVDTWSGEVVDVIYNFFW